MKYDYYYEETLGITFNTNINLLLKYARHYEGAKDSEDFYKVLYAIVEKEKYLQIKNPGYHSLLIEKLGEKSKKILENMFYSRMSDYQISKDSNYLLMVDPIYEKFFDNSSFKPGTYYSAIPTKIIPDVKIAVERKMLRKKYSLVDTITKKEIPCSLDLRKENLNIKRVLDFFVVKVSNNFLLTIYNKDFEKLTDCVSHYDIDYKNEYILLQYAGKPQVMVYDKNYNFITSFDRDITRIGKYEVNDGVIAVNTDRRVIYFDYLNQKEIGTFTIPKNISLSLTTLAYSDGLYNYVDENGLHGYKDIYGNVIIEPKLPRSSPFFNGVAYIRNIDGRFGHWFLDKNGKLFNFKTSDDVRTIEDGLELTETLKYVATAHYDTRLWSFPLSFSEQAYQIDIWGEIVGSLVGNSCYLIDNETPIMDLEIENLEKAKELNKKI